MEQKWLVDKNERTLDYYIKQLDFTLPYAKERLKLVNEILNVTTINDNNNNLDIISNDPWLKGYISSLGFTIQQVKTKTQFRCEDEPFCKGLERIADYIIFPKHDDQQDEINKVNRKKELLSKYKQKKNKEAEVLFGDKSDGSVNLDEAIKQKTFKVQTKPVVTEQDLKEFECLREMAKTIDALALTLGYGKAFSTEDRKAMQDKIKEESGEKYLFFLKKVYTELKSESLLMKEKLRGTIYFKHLGAGDTGAVITLEANSGYILEDTFVGTKVDRYDNTITYEAGDYVSVTENKIDFNNKDHIYQILNLYTPLKQACIDKPDSELWHIINTLEELIESANLSKIEKKILELKIDSLTGAEICDILKIEDSYDVTEQYISEIYLKMPDKLVETHKQLYEDWLYTFKVKGKYKRCKKCGNNKLANTKYFQKESKVKDGLRATCKVCSKK